MLCERKNEVSEVAGGRLLWKLLNCEPVSQVGKGSVSLEERKFPLCVSFCSQRSKS